MRRFEGKVAVVTGGSKGIGAAVVRRLSVEGATVFFTYRLDFEAARALAKIATPIQADALDESAVRSAFGGVGQFDVLVNNVGGAWLAMLQDTSEDLFRRVLGKNVYSLVVATREARQYIRKGGAIVNVASVVADLNPVGDGMALYNAAKAAVVSLTRTYSKELAARDIRVNTVSPGPTRTDGVAPRIAEMEAVASTSTLGKMSEPDDVAATVAFLASGDARMITGEVVRVSGGLGCG